MASHSIRPLLPRLAPRGLVLFAMAVAFSPLLAQQQTVYQWKDAKGVTHYADAPPSQSYRKRDINARLGTAVEVVETRKSANQVSCDNARANLVKLAGQGAVGVDNDGDGKADANMTAEQRASQVQLNQAVLKANCSASTSESGAK